MVPNSARVLVYLLQTRWGWPWERVHHPSIHIASMCLAHQHTGLSLSRFHTGASRGEWCWDETVHWPSWGEIHTLPILLGVPITGKWRKKQGSLRQIAPYLPTAPEVALGVGGDHQLAPYSRLELGTRD